MTLCASRALLCSAAFLPSALHSSPPVTSSRAAFLTAGRPQLKLKCRREIFHKAPGLSSAASSGN